MDPFAAPSPANLPAPFDPHLAQAGLPGPALADSVRRLASAMVAAAGAGDAALADRMADAATVLWTRFHKFDAADPGWPDRDRFVLSPGHGAPLLYALLHLTGHAGMEADALRAFRGPQAACAPHPDARAHPAVELTAGLPGQGLAMAVGLALAERLLAARFGRSLVDHRTWVIADDADLADGVALEAAALAGRLRLARLAVLWDDCAGEDQLKRFAATGWATARVDAHDGAAVAAALSMALRSRKPTLIACCAQASGDRAEPQADFAVRKAPAAVWQEAGARGERARRAWLKRLAANSHRAEFERAMAGNLPGNFHEIAAALRSELASAGLTLDGFAVHRRALDGIAPAVPDLVGMAAFPAAASPGGMAPVGSGQFAGRFVEVGARPQAMAAAMVAMAAHGGLVPFAEARLAQSDQLRPALRLAVLMGLRAVLVLTHDGANADGPAWHAPDQLAALRAIPGLHVFRPADAVEAAECWELALRRIDGPSAIVLPAATLPPLRADARENRCVRGGYVLAGSGGARRATLLATGAEVALALEARAALAREGVAVAVASLPCWELFALQDEAWRNEVLGFGPRLVMESGGGFGWERWADEAIGAAGGGPPQLPAVLAHLRRRLAP
jgi:transketolase